MARTDKKPTAAQIAQQQHDCLQLRLDGHTVRAIAAKLGMAVSTVQDRLTSAQTELVAPVADEVRLLELARLDRWQVRLEERLDDGEDPARVVPIGLKVQERRSRYLGLDAPERAEMTVSALGSDDPAVLDTLAAARERAQARIAALRSNAGPDDAA